MQLHWMEYDIKTSFSIIILTSSGQEIAAIVSTMLMIINIEEYLSWLDTVLSVTRTPH